MISLLLDRIYSSNLQPDVDELSVTAMMTLTTYMLGRDETDTTEERLDLHTIEPTRINPMELAMVLRALSPVRDAVLGYNYALGQCRNACLRCQLDPDDVMFGMLKEHA